MRHLLLITLLVGSALSAPASKEKEEDSKLTINKEFFPEEFKIHQAEHDIVQILVPLNSLNFDENEDSKEDNDKKVIFFVEADNVNGIKEYKGVSVYINGQVKKIAPTGTDVAADNDNTKTAYIAATDGIYKYNHVENTAEKYGTVKDSLIGIVKVNGSDVLYVLTEDHELYKVTEGGTQKEKVNDVADARQIVLDYENNLYYYGADKQPYVATVNGTKKIQGLPSDIHELNLLKPPFVIEDGIPAVVDNKAYIIYANGTSEVTDFEFEVKPTAYSMEATLIQYYAYDKKIYEYNVLVIILGELLDELKSFLNENANEINALTGKTRSELVAAR